MRFLLPLFLLLLSITTFSQEEKRKLPDYQIDSVIRNLNIKTGVCRFVFHFNGAPYNSSLNVLYAVNGKNSKSKLNKDNSLILDLKPDNYAFAFYYSKDYLEINTNSIEGKSGSITYISINLTYTKTEIMLEKPVIYLYPSEPLSVEVKVKPIGKLTFTYPDYKDSWKVIAEPNGNLKIDGKEYNYLFWEGKHITSFTDLKPNEGFIVESQNVISFLEEKLDLFGFTSKEKADFITYWGPQLIKNKKTYIKFLFNDQCNQFSNLEITPNPDHIYRFYMISASLDNGPIIDLKPQIIEPMNRTGFTVLEWGGSAIELKIKKNTTQEL